MKASYLGRLILLWRTLAVTSALLCQQGPAWADTPPDCAAPTLQEPISVAALQRILADVPACQKNAHLLAALGQLLNSQGLYLEAVDHLERALMLDSTLMDAQLSYAIALTGSGDLSSANALINNLLLDPALPSHLRPLLHRQKATLTGAPAELSGWQSRMTLASRVGFDSNLLGSPNLTSLALTMGSQTLVLPLDDSYQARGAGYIRTDAQAELQRKTPDGIRWDAVASLSSRNSQAVPEAGSTQIDFLLERSYNSPKGLGSYLSASATGLQTRSGTRHLVWGGAGGVSWFDAGAGGCQLRLGVEWQQRKDADTPVLLGHYAGGSVFWSCEQPTGAKWVIGLKAGRDAAQNAARPGGDQNLASLRLAGFLPLMGGWPGGILFDFEQNQLEDSVGYSPIIDSGRTRSLSRRAAHLEYQYPISRTVQWVLGAEWVAQASSLVLFRLDSWGSYTGARFSW